MNKLICILYILWPTIVWSQEGHLSSLAFSSQTKYFLISNKQKNIHHVVTEQTGTNYIGINSTKVEIFNILYPQVSRAISTDNRNYLNSKNSDTILVSISVLPLNSGQATWTPINLDSVPKSKILSNNDLLRKSSEQLSNFFRADKPLNRTLLTSDNIYPLIELNGKYYIPNSYVLTNTFLIKPYSIYNYEQADMAIIDIKSPIFLTSSLLKSASYHNNNPHAQLWASVFAGNLLQGKNHGRYEFWSNATLSSHASLLYYGIDKFLYQPGIGIVSGKYESYFSSKRQFIDDFLSIVSIDNRETKYP